MKKLNFFIVLIASFAILASCNNDDESLNEQENQQLYPKIAKKLESLYFNPNGLELIDFGLPDGTTQEMFLVEGDIVLSEKQIEEMKVGAGVTSKQYRSTNLANHGTYTVIGFTGASSSGLSSKEQTALRWAVDNYNRLNIGIHLNLSFGTNYQSKDIVVYRNNIGFAGGKSGFPSNGKPYKWVQINNIGGLNTNLIEHVITHEIGHSFGMRHTDWWSRQSCPASDQGNEGTAPYGAIHIPGTPTGYDSTSLMLACPPSDTNGEFNGNDVTALNFLY